MAEGLADREEYLRRSELLALSALPIVELPVVAAAPTHHDGVMVALVPDNPDQLAVEHAEALPADDLHITLCYLGKSQNLSNADKSKILAKANNVFNTVGHAFSASADGVVVMGQNDDGVPATALLVQSDDIVALYDAVASALDFRSKFPSFIPHMTLGYGVPVEDVEDKIGTPISFSNAIVKFGDDVHVAPLMTTAVTAATDNSNIIERVSNSLSQPWTEALHPRDTAGKFVKKNGAVSGKLAVPSPNGKGVQMVDAYRAPVVGFHTFDNEVWVLAEITNPDGTTTKGFAKSMDIRAVAPVKARLDALYPVEEDGATASAYLERCRQLDLLLCYMSTAFGPTNNAEAARSFAASLALSDQDMAYINKYLHDMRRMGARLTPEEQEEQAEIISDARNIKTMMDRSRGLEASVTGPEDSNRVT